VRRAAVVCLALCSMALAHPVRAEQGFALDGEVGYQDLTQAKSSAKAVFNGSSGGLTWGGGLRYTLKSGFFVAGWFRTFSKDGERVFVADATSPVFSLGHPLSVRIRSYQGTVGYRLSNRTIATPYVGIGAGETSYHEQSTVGGITDTVDESKTSYHGLVGVELGHGLLRIAAEGGYTMVPNAIGIGGVSKIYGETGIGGFWAVGKLVLTSGN